MSESARLKSPLILDGAMGTELERRGFDARLPLWSAWALIEAPDLVKQIHADYVRAGAQVLTAATFRTTRYSLAKENLASWAEELAALAIRLAREAAEEADPETEITVAGSLAPLEDCYHPEQAPSNEVLAREHAHTAGLLAAAGADLILVETQNSAREAMIAARVALATGLPVWVSLMPRSADQLFNGDSLADTAKTIYELGVEAILVNCCPPDVAKDAVRLLRKTLPDARLGAYPNSAAHEGRPWEFASAYAPSTFARWALDIAGEVDILGSCCGTTPEHVAAMVRELRGEMRNEK
jgi:S-methylmethionine-dependent homocysteine/selenocysteine methylase